MSSTDCPRRLLSAALLAAMASLAGCSGPAGESELAPLRGASLRANADVHVDQVRGGDGGGRLARAFAAGAEPTVTFAFDDASLNAEAQAILDDQAAWLRAHPGVPVTIVGHTDLVGPERYNEGLGLRRAESARNHLVASGVRAERLLAVESRGERDPVVPTADRERLNRRAVTMVGRRGGAAGAPGLDGSYAARLYDTYQAGTAAVTEAEPITVN